MWGERDSGKGGVSVGRETLVREGRGLSVGRETLVREGLVWGERLW